MCWVLQTSKLGRCWNISYGNITAVDLENNFDQMRRAWDPQQPFESLLKQIKDCADYSKAGVIIIVHPQKINVGYAQKKLTGHFMSACQRWNEKPSVEKTWAQFKTHFAAAYRQNKQMQVESAATSGYHAEKAFVGQTHLVYAVVFDQEQLYTDLTGRFLVRSSKGNWYVMVCSIPGR
jgi:hypothetical protein